MGEVVEQTLGNVKREYGWPREYGRRMDVQVADGDEAKGMEEGDTGVW